MQISAFFLFIGALIQPSPAFTLDLTACDVLYSNRGANSILASDCYQALLPSAVTSNEQIELYSRSFIALSAAVNELPTTDSEGLAIAKGLAILTQLQATQASSAEYLYWNAVFTSFNATRLDRGSILPRNIFKAIKVLQQNLTQARTLNPGLHFYGPSRVLGIMHTSMPGIVGGDKTLAEKRLSEAFLAAPILSANWIAYAKILIINGKSDQAKAILTEFLSKSDSELDPYPSEPLRALTSEIKRDRKIAEEMLINL